VTAAAASADLKPGTDFRVSITNPEGEPAYPISSFTWLLVKPANADSTKAAELKAFLTWMISPEAQRMAAELHYAPLPIEVVELVRRNPGSIGYVELIYAVSNGLPYADVKNSAGNFVEPSLASVTAAASGADLKPGTDFRVSITNPAGEAAYPISSFTWLLVKPSNPDSTKAAQIKAFLTWMISADAQRMATDLHYAPLPMPVIELVQQRLEGLSEFGGGAWGVGRGNWGFCPTPHALRLTPAP
jgi:ABC-type phosphate transport system substrate-binding protein